MKKVGRTAAPMVAVTLLQQLLQFVSIMMAGHLDQLSLSGFSIANSFTNVSGFCFLYGMCGALETLCGQAYGAMQYKRIGAYTYTAIFNLILVCFPISVLWIFLDKILILLGQDPSISHVAHKFILFLIPSLFPFAILEAMIRYFQTQNLILPLLFSSLAALCFHVLFCWALVFKLGFGINGIAISKVSTHCLNVILLGLYIKYSSKCDKTCASLSIKDVFQSTKLFLRFAFPSAAMVCLEWWAYEILIILSGLLPNPKLESSVISICFSITYLHYYIPYGIGATGSTRVSNELGSGNPQAAKMAVWIVMVIALVETVIVSATLFFCRRIVGYAFTSDEEVVGRVADMVPIMSLTIIVDCLQAVFSGVARGCGWQKTAALVNLGAYYLVGTPLGAILAFVFHLKVKGLFIGLMVGVASQAIVLGLITVFTDWQNQASKARKLMVEEASNNEIFGENTTQVGANAI